MAAQALVLRWQNGERIAQASLPLVEQGALELLQRQCTLGLDAAVSVAVALVRPLKHRHPHPDGQRCIVRVLEAVVAGLWHCATRDMPGALDWVKVMIRGLGMLQPRVAAGKWKAAGAQLSVWLQGDTLIWVAMNDVHLPSARLHCASSHIGEHFAPRAPVARCGYGQPFA